MALTVPTISYNGSGAIKLGRGSLSVSCGAELEGARLSAVLSIGTAVPFIDDKLELTASGLSFVGRLRRWQSQSLKMNHRIAIDAVGLQEFLQRPLAGTFSGTASSILSTVLTGVPMTGSVIGEDREVSFEEQTSVANALNQLAAAGNYIICVRPDGSIKLVDPDDPGSVAGTIAHGDAGVKRLEISREKNLTVNQFVVKGSPGRNTDGEDAEVELTIEHTADGTKTEFGYPFEATKVRKVENAGAEQSFVAFDDPDAGSAAVTNNRFKHAVKFATAPTASNIVKITYAIAFPRAEWNDTGSQATYSSRFGGDGVVGKTESRSEIQTDAEAQSVADAVGPTLNDEMVSAQAELAGVSLFFPGDLVTVTDSRLSFEMDLVVTSATYAWNTGLNGWKQSLTLTNKRHPQGLAARLVGVRRPGRLPATVASPGGAGQDFSVEISPGTRTITGYGCETYTVTVTPANGFLGTVTLSASGLPAGVTAAFSPGSVVINSGSAQTSTLTLCHDDPIESDSSTTFTVTGTWHSLTHNDTADIVLEIGCEPGTFDHFVFSADCSGVPSDCCDLPFFPDQVAISWSVEFFDTCGNSMSTDEGIMYISQGASCTVVENGENTFSNPYTGLTYSVLEEGGSDCNCIVA